MTLERRLTALELAVSELNQKLGGGSVSEDWLQRLKGSISDEAAFAEALEYGRTFRQSDQPVDEDSQ
jgi:hypothetical protein